ncbi:MULTISPECIES: hypothetical protein [unclassified Streptomyces]|uniref:hypothetical protein n=1 Tax=unclassified Streptomyces TaxID=2593676 RepID=UPI0011AF3A58|nr:hypothetical protein [Streptomyces sp. CB02959]
MLKLHCCDFFRRFPSLIPVADQPLLAAANLSADIAGRFSPQGFSLWLLAAVPVAAAVLYAMAHRERNG